MFYTFHIATIKNTLQPQVALFQSLIDVGANEPLNSVPGAKVSYRICDVLLEASELENTLFKYSLDGPLLILWLSISPQTCSLQGYSLYSLLLCL